MSPEAEIYRRAIIRAVTGRAGVLHTEYDAAILADLCEQLARGEEATSILRHLGYGKAGMWVDEIAATVPQREAHGLGNEKQA